MWAYRISLSCMLLVGCIFPDDHDRDDDRDWDDRDQQSEESSSGSAGTGGREPSRPAPAADFCEDWARAACTDAVVFACQASDETECQKTQTEFCRGLIPTELATSGRDACISAVGLAYRDADLRGDELALVLRFQGACARLIIGESAQGAECTSSSDCDIARGYSCVRKADTGAGTCQIAESVEPGRSCREPEESCEEGFFCDGRYCVETLPVAEACSIHEQCGADGFCDESGKCAERRDVNDSCQEDVECATGICSELDDEKLCTDRVVLSRADPLCTNLR
jgi:hypothetical protein